MHYRKKLLQRVLTNIDGGATATELVEVVNILGAIHWIHQDWALATSETIMKCFIKFGFPALNFSADDLLDVHNVDTELQELANLRNIGMESNTDTITDCVTMEEDKMQLHQLDSANWEEELLSMQPTEHASLTGNPG